MPSTPITTFTSRYAVLPVDNVDTDQIIPARFLTTTERTGLGAYAFHDWRRAADGSPRAEFPLNQPDAEGAQVLVAGRNFGCGSSREHAVWALLDAGFRAVISAEFADIFRGNALGNGLLPIQVDATVVAKLAARAAAPDRYVSVNLADQEIVLPYGESAHFPIAPFARHCLVHGIDEMDFLLGAADDVAAYEHAHTPRVTTITPRRVA